MKNIVNRQVKILLPALALLITALIPFGVKAANVTALSSNCAPIAENLEIKTYKQIAVTAPLRAIDPDGDLVSYSLISAPRKGTVSISGDKFTYTPASGSKSDDSFTYVATDYSGAVSKEATVSINILGTKSGISYSDMDGSESAYAAQRLAEKGIFVGRKVGDSYFFDPEAEVTRGEFLAMCMNAAGMEQLNGVSRTGFYDDEAISAWAKPYVSSALLAGVVKGYREDDGTVVFLPQQAITFSEAAVMLSGVLEISDVSSECSVPRDAVETWAYQSVANLEQCSIITSGTDYQGNKPLTRAEAADMLSGAMDILEKRDDGKGTSILDWLFK